MLMVRNTDPWKTRRTMLKGEAHATASIVERRITQLRPAADLCSASTVEGTGTPATSASKNNQKRRTTPKKAKRVKTNQRAKQKEPRRLRKARPRPQSRRPQNPRQGTSTWTEEGWGLVQTRLFVAGWVASTVGTLITQQRTVPNLCSAPCARTTDTLPTNASAATTVEAIICSQNAKRHGTAAVVGRRAIPPTSVTHPPVKLEKGPKSSSSKCSRHACLQMPLQRRPGQRPRPKSCRTEPLQQRRLPLQVLR
mmetsp:Transcript_75041/g.125021  ORF Transcript_75041/g.125021 Transcript_75041/m.125021 type:complete len:253 (-) Transcript_75041:685-1443(-)